MVRSNVKYVCSCAYIVYHGVFRFTTVLQLGKYQKRVPADEELSYMIRLLFIILRNRYTTSMYIETLKGHVWCMKNKCKSAESRQPDK